MILEIMMLRFLFPRRKCEASDSLSHRFQLLSMPLTAISLLEILPLARKIMIIELLENIKKFRIISIRLSHFLRVEIFDSEILRVSSENILRMRLQQPLHRMENSKMLSG